MDCLELRKFTKIKWEKIFKFIEEIYSIIKLVIIRKVVWLDKAKGF